MSRRKSRRQRGDSPFRLHPAHGPADEVSAEDMLQASVQSLAEELDKIPRAGRREAAMFMAGQMLLAAAEGDMVQVAGMLEVMKTNMILPEWCEALDPPLARDTGFDDEEP